MKFGKKEEFNFRDLYHNVVLILDKKFLRTIKDEYEIKEEDNAVLAYGYIDHDAGLSFEVLCSAYVEDSGKYTLREGNDMISCKIRSGSINEDIVSLGNEHKLRFSDKIKIINEGYRSSNEIEYTRDIIELDEFRHVDFPDDIGVIFYKEGVNLEGIWCRLEGMISNSFKAEVLNTPYSDFGVTEGDIIEFRLYEMEDGLKAIAIF